MKKILISCLLASVAISALAVLPSQFIRLRKISNVIDIPTIRPISVGEEPAFACMLDGDGLLVISNTITDDVDIIIITEAGTEIIHEVVYLASGAEHSISLDALPAGAYTLYISCAHDTWYGDFVVE